MNQQPEAPHQRLGPPVRRSFQFFFATVVAVFGWVVLRPLVAPMVLAVLTAVVFEPVHLRVQRILGEGKFRGALCSLLLVTVLVGAPSVAFILLFLFQLRSVLLELTVAAQGLEPASRLANLVDQYLDWSARFATRYLGESFDLRASWMQAIQNMTATLYEQLPDFVVYVGQVLLAFLVLNIVLFFLFLEGRELVDRLIELSPLESSYSRRILERVEQMIRGVFLGSLLTASVQGVVGTIAFFLTGFQNYMVWGVLIAGAALVPFVGTALVWVPAVIYLLAVGETRTGLVLLLCGIGIGTVDNFIRPLMIRVRAPIHPLVIFLAVLGGIQTVGPMGVVYGPLLAAIVIEAARIYHEDFGAPPIDAPPGPAESPTVRQ